MKTLVFLLLLATATVSFGQSEATDNTAPTPNWTRVLGDSKGTIYFDLRRVTRTGNTIRVWVLINFTVGLKTASGDVTRSSVVQWFFKCKEGTQAKGQSFAYSGHNMTGSNQRDDTMEQFVEAVPGSVDDAVFDAACGGKWIK